jgi:hypothetical protein
MRSDGTWALLSIQGQTNAKPVREKTLKEGQLLVTAFTSEKARQPASEAAGATRFNRFVTGYPAQV